jgi:hypothetical protein
VALPEDLQDPVVADALGIEDDQHDLVVARQARAHFLVGRIRRQPGRVADRGREDSGRLPELALGAPEAAETEHRRLEPRWKRRRERMTVHEVLGRHRHALGPAGQRVLARRHHQLGSRPPHTCLLRPRPSHASSSRPTARCDSRRDP